jgi:hypothetical protein
VRARITGEIILNIDEMFFIGAINRALLAWEWARKLAEQQLVLLF